VAILASPCKKALFRKEKNCFITLFRNREASLRSAPTCGEKGMLLWKIGWRFLKTKQNKTKQKPELPYDPAIPLLSIYSDKTNLKRYHSYIHSNTIYNSQYKETA